MSRVEGRSDRESIKVTYHRETEKAWLVSAEHGNDEVWIPKSQCDLMPEYPDPGEDCWLMIPQWLLNKCGL